MDKKGITLIELLIVVGIIGILAMIAIPAYVGQQKRAARTEAYSNLENLRLLEEQFFAENSVYTATTGTCLADNDNIAAIQAVLPGFKPGSGLSFSYCIEQNIRLDGTGTAPTPCFRARAFGNTGSRVDGDEFIIDCNNNRNF
jgi:prepilin-type N-terminal cleavage/methylation domain-containing protein